MAEDHRPVGEVAISAPSRYSRARLQGHDGLPMLISPAYAQAAGRTARYLRLMQFLPLVLIFVVFYFLLIRPQQKKKKQHREMIEALRRGDRVLTGGGIIGTVIKVVSDSELEVEIAEGVRVRVARRPSEVLAKPEPAAAAKAPRSRTPKKPQGQGPQRQRLIAASNGRAGSCCISRNGRFGSVVAIVIGCIIVSIPNLFIPTAAVDAVLVLQKSRSRSVSTCAAARICCSRSM